MRNGSYGQNLAITGNVAVTNLATFSSNVSMSRVSQCQHFRVM